MPNGDNTTTPPGPIGAATPIADPSAKPSPILRLDGDCLTGTLANLEQGIASDPMPRSTLDKTTKQVESLLSDVLVTYSNDVASGELGVGGTAKASPAPPSAGRCPTGLLYGRVQSGKTLAMITFVSMAIDNGFRVVVVFTSNYVKLVEQTADRFQALNGPLVKSSTSIDTWDADVDHVRKYLPSHGVVLVCAKDPNHLETMLTFLGKIGAPDYPALILDDEADQATPDTTTSARAAQKPTAPAQGSTINRKIVRNDAAAEIGQSVRETLRHNVFVQVTATPFPLLLQNIDNPLRPKFTKLLEPGDGYTGGEKFFADTHVTTRGGAPPLVFVREEESQEIERGPAEAPLGLTQAISFFLLSSSAQSLMDPSSLGIGQNFLCHTSQKQTEHEKVGNLIRSFLTKLADDLNPDGTIRPGPAAIRLAWAYEELKKTVPDAPSLEALVKRLGARLPLRNLLIVNSTGSNAEFGRQLNFIVGGNILGRGLTIRNLLVTYYLRRAKITQMDTMLQHARMFGYREKIMKFSRVFLPMSLAVRFHRIHVAERDLRSLLSDPSARTRIPVQITTGLRATRPSVLDTGAIGAFRSGQQVYPVLPVFKRSELGTVTDRLEKLLKKAFGGAVRDRDFVDVPLDSLIEIIEQIKTDDDDSGEWDTEAIIAVLKSIAPGFNRTGAIFCRTMSRESGPYLPNGAISGDEHDRARALDRPVLFMIKEAGTADCWDSTPFWYPTLVFPPSMPNQVFNLSE